MTTMIDSVLGGAGVRSNSSMFGTFFVYTLALCMPIFKKKSSRIFLVESFKLLIVCSKYTLGEFEVTIFRFN